MKTKFLTSVFLTSVLFASQMGVSFAWSINGSGDIYFDSGKVGIGTSSPNEALEVQGMPGDRYVNLLIKNTTGDKGASLTMENNLGESWQIKNTGDGDLKIVDKVNNVNALYMVSNSEPTIGLGTSNPSANLHIEGGKGLLVEGGEIGNPSTLIPTEGQGIRMMWYPAKASFRAGEVTGDRWDDFKIGNYSTAMGLNTVASGESSFAVGNDNVAGGYNSFVAGLSNRVSGDESASLGNGNTVSGPNSFVVGSDNFVRGGYSLVSGDSNIVDGSWSFATGDSNTANAAYSSVFGHGTTANGERSTAFGDSTIANGERSTAFGDSTIANSDDSFVIGKYNKGVNGSLFEIGNGVNGLERRNAFIVTVNGNVGVGTVTDAKSRFQVDGGYIQIDTTNTAPLAIDCDDNLERGRMIVDSSNDKLYVCVDSGWKTSDLI